VRLLERLADCHGVKLHIVLTYIVGDDFSTMDLKLNDSAVRGFCSETFVLSLNIRSSLHCSKHFLRSVSTAKTRKSNRDEPFDSENAEVHCSELSCTVCSVDKDVSNTVLVS